MSQESVIQTSRELEWITAAFDAVPLTHIPEPSEKESSTVPTSEDTINTDTWVGPPNPEFAIGLPLWPLAKWVLSKIGPSILLVAVKKLFPGPISSEIAAIVAKGKNDTTINQVADKIKGYVVEAISKILGSGIGKRVGSLVANLLAAYFF